MTLEEQLDKYVIEKKKKHSLICQKAMFATRFSLSRVTPIPCCISVGPRLRPQGWSGNWENYEVPDREMTRKLRKKKHENRELFTGYRVKALQLDYGSRSRENLAQKSDWLKGRMACFNSQSEVTYLPLFVCHSLVSLEKAL